jgi:hypothetical protein
MLTVARMTNSRLDSTMLRGVVVLAAFLLPFAAGCGGDDDEGGTTAAVPSTNPDEYTTEVDNKFHPLASIRTMTYEGKEKDPDTGEEIETRAELAVTDKTETIAGIDGIVVVVDEYEDGEKVEHTEDYYAQASDGTVIYLGEKVDDIEDGKVTGHEGQWLAGEGENKPGTFMPPDPSVGDVFEQERAPGVAEDVTTVLETGVDVETPAGKFTDCMKVEDLAPLTDTKETKYYCPGVGLVREEAEGAELNLVSYEKA